MDTTGTQPEVKRENPCVQAQIYGPKYNEQDMSYCSDVSYLVDKLITCYDLFIGRLAKIKLCIFPWDIKIFKA